MRVSILVFASVALAARPFLNEPDTGIDEALGSTPDGTLPDLDSLVGLPDFEWAARRGMNTSAYTYYRNGAAGEWSYRNNLEVFQRFRLRPRVMVDITKIESTLPTTILGHNFSAPFFISPCARGGYAHPDGELNLVKGAGAGNILYMPALYASKSIEDIYMARVSNASTPQVLFQQVYLTENDTETQQLFARIEKAGSKAIIMTVDSAADGNRHRARRYGVGSADSSYSYLTWDLYHKLSNMTKLPIIPKGIQTLDDARLAVENGVKAFMISNHGGRQLDTTPSSLEVALEIYNEDPEIFKQVEVYADGGVRYGADVLKLLALGVKAVGVGRPFMFSNVYGVDGVKRVIEMLKHEVAIDAANLGVGDLKKIGPEYVNWKSVNGWFS
ncbi:FMN-dependent alpha-hydroxy acid dehydrogenase [Lentithecium fluviatile CBS 122367]|uniref:FMN-dependent alpha-hydroxy acid dehydrogenase n=1 Tax=Lentithecium fluviatile CBS 122367 TaxID=1168545 RepID=A0A6G1IJA5_9PLEO|nr:FMN-dependent alpha-hydroxy acid dehydrogenase [Lentithecium fluviatile CBS 122367]